MGSINRTYYLSHPIIETILYTDPNHPGSKQGIENEKKALGVPGFEEHLLFTIFVFAAFCWIIRTFILTKFTPNLDDTILAILSRIILFLLPAKSNGETPYWHWQMRKTCHGRSSFYSEGASRLQQALKKPGWQHESVSN
ncbi:anion permease [Bacillus sp. V3]|nr:anion permease [Bacillus sp. V3]